MKCEVRARLWLATVMLSTMVWLAADGWVRTAAADTLEEIRIGDSTGDWGLPNPFRHYPRGPGYVRMSWVFDTLVWKDRKGVIPGLADSWSYDANSRSFTFQLSPKAQWHDGRPVTADDVVFTVAYFKKHPYRWITLDHVDRGEARGEHTVVLFLSKPYAPFMSDIAGAMPIIPRHIWEPVSSPEALEAPRACIGSGPYRFKDFNKTQGTYLYEAFENYHRGRPRAERLIYVHSDKPLVSLLTGQVDLAAIEPEMAEPLAQKGLTVIRDEKGWNRKLMINHERPPFNDQRMRQALAFAIDRQEIVDKGHRGFGSPASQGMLSPDHAMYNPETAQYPFDPDRARKLIESMGYSLDPGGAYTKDGGPLWIELLSSNISAGGESIADRDGEIIKRQLEKVGIHVSLLNLEQATTDNRVKNRDFDLAVSGHGGIGGDPKVLNELISSKYGVGSVNCARYDGNTVLNQLLEDQMVEMDESKRKEIVQKIQQIVAEDLPVICLYYQDSMSAYHPNKGITWFYTRGGLGKGVPIPQNKVSLLP